MKREVSWRFYRVESSQIAWAGRDKRETRLSRKSATGYIAILAENLSEIGITTFD
jgi:hypothetical protein